MNVRAITARECWPLRQQVLRPHQRLEEMDYANDSNPVSFHLGVFEQGRLIAVGSFYQERNDELPGAVQWRLRGMAVHADHRNRNVGGTLLARALDELRARQVDVLWCHARESAMRFYERHGFAVHGPRFVIEPIGGHYVMHRRP
jgi:GNAT superfamily N-acetyltransferase